MIFRSRFYVCVFAWSPSSVHFFVPVWSWLLFVCLFLVVICLFLGLFWCFWGVFLLCFDWVFACFGCLFWVL